LRRPNGNQHGRWRTRRDRDGAIANPDLEFVVETGPFGARQAASCRRRIVTMSTRKTTLFYALLIAVASLAVGMVLASRLDLTPASSAQTINVPATNSSPITGPLSADTFRNIAKAVTPSVVNIRTEMKAKSNDLTEFFGGRG